MKHQIIFCIFLFFSLSFTSQIIPIPKIEEGVILGDRATSIIHLEAHFDLLCPDCRDSYSNLSRVIQELDLFNKNFSMTVHFFPWPFHTYSFLTTVGAKFIQTVKGSSAAQGYMEAIFRQQYIFSGDYLTINQTEENICQIITQWIALNSTECAEIFNSTVYNNMARVSLKIGSQRSVVATPTYFVNDVRLDDSKTYDYQDWLNFAYEYVLGWGPKNFLD